jgi:hypothetical protein
MYLRRKIPVTHGKELSPKEDKECAKHFQLSNKEPKIIYKSPHLTPTFIRLQLVTDNLICLYEVRHYSSVLSDIFYFP